MKESKGIICDTTIQLKCMIKATGFDHDIRALTKEQLASIHVQVEMAINSIPSVAIEQPNCLAGIRVHIIKEK